MVKTPWQYLGHKSHCWKANFFKICVFVKYFRQRLLSLVNMGLHAMIIRLSLLIHEGEQRWVASVTPRGYAPAMVTLGRGHWGLLHMCRNVGFLLFHCWVTIMTIFWQLIPDSAVSPHPTPQGMFCMKDFWASATEILFRWPKICLESGQEHWLVVVECSSHFVSAIVYKWLRKDKYMGHKDQMQKC